MRDKHKFAMCNQPNLVGNKVCVIPDGGGKEDIDTGGKKSSLKTFGMSKQAKSDVKHGKDGKKETKIDKGRRKVLSFRKKQNIPDEKRNKFKVEISSFDDMIGMSNRQTAETHMGIQPDQVAYDMGQALKEDKGRSQEITLLEAAKPKEDFSCSDGLIPEENLLQADGDKVEPNVQNPNDHENSSIPWFFNEGTTIPWISKADKYSDGTPDGLEPLFSSRKGKQRHEKNLSEFVKIAEDSPRSNKTISEKMLRKNRTSRKYKSSKDTHPSIGCSTQRIGPTLKNPNKVKSLKKLTSSAAGAFDKESKKTLLFFCDKEKRPFLPEKTTKGVKNDNSQEKGECFVSKQNIKDGETLLGRNFCSMLEMSLDEEIKALLAQKNLKNKKEHKIVKCKTVVSSRARGTYGRVKGLELKKKALPAQKSQKRSPEEPKREQDVNEAQIPKVSSSMKSSSSLLEGSLAVEKKVN